MDKFQFIEPRYQLNTTSTKPLLDGNMHNHATAVFLFPFLPLANIAFEEFGLFKDMYKLPEFHIRQSGIFSEIRLYFLNEIAYNEPNDKSKLLGDSK